MLSGVDCPVPLWLVQLSVLLEPRLTHLNDSTVSRDIQRGGKQSKRLHCIMGSYVAVFKKYKARSAAMRGYDQSRSVAPNLASARSSITDYIIQTAGMVIAIFLDRKSWKTLSSEVFLWLLSSADICQAVRLEACATLPLLD